MTEPDHEEERTSLAPLTAEEALRALLAVDPDDEPAEDDPDTGQPRTESDADNTHDE